MPGHVVGIVEFKGLSFFAYGEIATHSNPATFDLTYWSKIPWMITSAGVSSVLS